MATNSSESDGRVHAGVAVLGGAGRPYAEKRRQVTVHIGTSASTFVIAVTGSYAKDLQGYVRHMYTDSIIPFATLFEAVSSMHAIADGLDYPQRGYRLRSWGGIQSKRAESGGGRLPPPEPGGLSDQHGGGSAQPSEFSRKASTLSGTARAAVGPSKDDGLAVSQPKALFTVLVRLQYRQNASWQGEAHFEAATGPVRFRSVFELMHLLAEAGYAML